jgi:hypothetical protein
MVEDNALGAEWADTYRGFSDDQKWFLRSDRAVEDVLYEQGIKSPWDSAICLLLSRWIVAVDNSTMKSWFSTAEWDEIISSVPRLPQPDTTFVQSLIRFHVVWPTPIYSHFCANVARLHLSKTCARCCSAPLAFRRSRPTSGSCISILSGRIRLYVRCM